MQSPGMQQIQNNPAAGPLPFFAGQNGLIHSCSLCALQKLSTGRDALLRELSNEKKESKGREDQLAKKVAALDVVKRNLQVRLAPCLVSYVYAQRLPSPNLMLQLAVWLVAASSWS